MKTPNYTREAGSLMEAEAFKKLRKAPRASSIGIINNGETSYVIAYKDKAKKRAFVKMELSFLMLLINDYMQSSFEDFKK